QDVCSSAVEVAAIGFIAEEGDVAFRRRQRVGFPRKADRGDVNLSLHLTRRAHAGEAEVSGGVLDLQWLTGGLPDHLEAHACGGGEGVERRPAWLVDHRDVAHLESEGACIGADGQAWLRASASGNGS